MQGPQIVKDLGGPGKGRVKAMEKDPEDRRSMHEEPGQELEAEAPSGDGFGFLGGATEDLIVRHMLYMFIVVCLSPDNGPQNFRPCSLQRSFGPLPQRMPNKRRMVLAAPEER
jgi:hypothetical protein